MVGRGFTGGGRDVRGFRAPDHDDDESAPNQTFQQVQVRALHRVAAKLDVRASLGAQISQFQDGENEGPNLIFNLGSSWQAAERTSVAVDAYRQDRPSYVFSGRNYTATGIRASVRQLFLEKYTAILATGYENTDYSNISSENRGGPDRTDNYFWVRPTLDYQFDDHWTMGVFYQFRTKCSDQPDDAFDY